MRGWPCFRKDLKISTWFWNLFCKKIFINLIFLDRLNRDVTSRQSNQDFLKIGIITTELVTKNTRLRCHKTFVLAWAMKTNALFLSMTFFFEWLKNKSCLYLFIIRDADVIKYLVFIFLAVCAWFCSLFPPLPPATIRGLNFGSSLW